MTDSPIASAPVSCFCGGSLGPGLHPLYGACRDCGTQVLKARATPEQLRKFYGIDTYWRGHVVDVSGYPSIDERARSDMTERVPYWLSLVAALGGMPERLLEIGCAHGGFLAMARERGVRIAVGVEVDEETCRFARDTFGLSTVLAGLFPDVILPEKRFDLVCGFDVIEHFPDPVAALAQVARLIAGGGSFLFQTPIYRGQGADWENFRPEEHLYLYTEAGLARLFAMAGLRLDFIAPGLFPEDVFVAGGAGELADAGGVALIRADSIGDHVLFSQALAPLRARYPGSRLAMVCQESVAGLYDRCPNVDEVIGVSRFYYREIPAYQVYLAKALARKRFAVAINAAYSRDAISDRLTLATGAGKRIALEGDLANTDAAQRERADAGYTSLIGSPGAWKPEILRTRDLLAGLSAIAEPKDPVRLDYSAGTWPEVFIGPGERAKAERIFGENGLDANTLGLFCGAQFAERLYLHYGAALASVAREFGLSVVALGSGRDLPVAEASLAELARVGVKVVDLTGATSIPLAAAILEKCRLAAGAETGLAHLACAVGVPNAVVLGGGHFGRFMPWSPLSTSACLPLSCFGCNWRCRFESVYCVSSLAPMVFAAACRAALNGPSRLPKVFYQARDLWPVGDCLGKDASGSADGPDCGIPSWSLDAAAALLPECELIEVAEPSGRDPLVAELLARAGELKAAGRFDAAFAFYSKALAKAPDDHDILRLTAEVLISLQRSDEALSRLSRAFELYPHDARVAAALSALIRASGQDALAGEVEAVFAGLHPEYR